MANFLKIKSFAHAEFNVKIQAATLSPAPDNQRMIQELHSELSGLYDVFAEKVYDDYVALRQNYIKNFATNCEVNQDETDCRIKLLKERLDELQRYREDMKDTR